MNGSYSYILHDISYLDYNYSHFIDLTVINRKLHMHKSSTDMDDGAELPAVMPVHL